MQADFAGDLAQGQRAQCLFAEFQEAGLHLEQAAHDLEQGLAAGLQALEQPARLLQLVAQVAGVALAAMADHLLIAAVDRHPGHGLVGQGHLPHPTLAPDDAVGDHVVVRVDFADLLARARVERAHQLHGLFDRIQRRAQFLGDAGDAAAWQPFQRAVDDAQGQGVAGRVGGQGVQLQPQAFAQAARGHAHRVHALHLVQHGQDLVLPGRCFRQQGLGDGLQRLAQVAVLVQGVDQRRADAAVAR